MGWTTLFSGVHAEITGWTLSFTGVHATITGWTAPFTGVHAMVMGCTPAYSAVHALLFGEYFVLRAAVLAIHDRGVAIAVVLVVAVTDAVAGAVDVGCGLEAALVEADEIMLIGKATSVGDFVVGQLRMAQQLLRLEEAPLLDELGKAEARQEFDGGAELAIRDIEAVGQVLCFKQAGLVQYFDDGSQDVLRELCVGLVGVLGNTGRVLGEETLYAIDWGK